MITFNLIMPFFFFELLRVSTVFGVRVCISVDR